MILLLKLPQAALAASVTLNPGDDVATLTSSLVAGDVITFSAGTYTLEGRVTWSGEGTEDAPILIQAAPGAEVVLEGAFNDHLVLISDASHIEVRGISLRGAEVEDTSPGGLRLQNTRHVLLEDVEVSGMRRSAIYLSGDNTSPVIRGCHLHDLEAGSALYAGCGDASCWTEGALIELNWIHDIADERGYGVAIDNGGQGNVVADNNIYNVGYIGVYTASTEYGEPNLIEGNAVWGTGSHALTVAGAARVRNNLIFNARGHGLYSTDSRGALEGLVVSHNTVVDTVEAGVRLQSWAGREGMVFANNVVANPTGRAFYASDTDLDEAVTLTGNVMTGLVEGLDALAGHFSGGGGHQDFVDADAWDFYPASGSSLVGVADPSAEAWVPELDFNGLPRDGAAPDVGAYERSSAENPGWTVQEGFKELGGQTGSDPDNQVGGCCADEGTGARGALLLPWVALGWRRRRRA